jgi:DNA polymerase-3 subunit delta'
MSWGLIGHDWAEALLQRHIAQSAVRHAYLITGPAGLGKRSLAMRFAQALNCSNAESPGELCGRPDCRSCSLTPVERYPDLHLVAPDGTTKIDEIRELQAKLALAPYEGRWRVAILTDFHLATESAANALLKILEEPPPKVILLLTAPDIDSLPLTVSSRCEQLALRSVERGAIEAALVQRGLDSAEAGSLAALAAGRPGVAIALSEDPQLLEQRSLAVSELVGLLGTGRVERFAEVQRLIGRGPLPAQRERVRVLLEVWSGVWRDWVHRGYGSPAELHDPDSAERLASGTRPVEPSELAAGLAAISQAQSAVLDNANLRLTLEELMLALPEPRVTAELSGSA